MVKCEDMPYNVLTMRLLEALDAKKECIKVSKHNDYGFGISQEGVIFHVVERTITLTCSSSTINSTLESSYSIIIEYSSKKEHYNINYIDGELMLKSIIQWYENKIEAIKENNKKQLLIDTISCVENYKDQ